MKNLSIAALRITRNDKVKCYAKLKFKVVDPTISEMVELMGDDILESIYESSEKMKSKIIEIHVLPITP